VGNYPTQKFDHANRASAAEILAPILEHRAKRPLLLQSEISDHHLSLKQTSAARALYTQLEPLRSVYDRKQEVILDALSKASDKERVEELIEQRGIWEARIDRIEKEQDELKENFGERLQGHLLRMLGLGFVLRSVCLRYASAYPSPDFDSQTRGFAQEARRRGRRLRTPGRRK
jgi:endonuclease III